MTTRAAKKEQVPNRNVMDDDRVCPLIKMTIANVAATLNTISLITVKARNNRGMYLIHIKERNAEITQERIVAMII
jgi:hypothetical protein